MPVPQQERRRTAQRRAGRKQGAIVWHNINWRSSARGTWAQHRGNFGQKARHHLRLHPQQKGEAFCLVSMAAGLSLARLAEMAGLACPIVRIMPNTPCAIGKGMTLVVKNEQASGAQAAELCTLLAAAGEFDVIDEGLMDAGSVISGCVGAWAQMFIEALADGAVEAGVPRAKAQKYAAGAVLGAAALALESGRHPGQLKDEVCSPAGSTIAGVHALERAGLRAAAMDAVAAAFARTKEMGKQ